MNDRYQPLRDAIAATFDGEWHAPGLGEVHDEDHRVIAMCIDTDPVGPGESPFPSLAEGERIAGLIVAAVNTAPALLKERDVLREAADMALNVLIGCVVAGDGVDDQRSMLEAQSMLRAALADGEASNG